MCSCAHCTSLGSSELGAPPPGWRDFWEQEGTSLEAPFTTSFRGRGGPPSAGSRCPPRSFHAGPSLATLPDHAESGGPRDPSGSACDLCKRPRLGLWIPGSVLPEPFCTLSPGPPPLDTGPHPQGPMTPWGSLVSCLLCFSPARPLSQFLHFRPHGWDKPGSLDTWQAEGPPPSWSSRPFCGLGLATAHSCASSTLHNFCWVRGQMHTQPHVETHGFAERQHGVHARDDALSPHVPAAPESSAPDRGCPAGLRWFPSLLRLERDHRGP